MSQRDDYSMDDDSIDIELGEWLLSQRKKRKIPIADASKYTGIDYRRLDDLEKGAFEKGITEKELCSLADLYKIDPKIIKNKALGYR